MKYQDSKNLGAIKPKIGICITQFYTVQNFGGHLEWQTFLRLWRPNFKHTPGL